MSSLVARSEIPAAGMCGGKPCWKPTSKGFRYKDSLQLEDGIKVITLKAGVAGAAKIILKGNGSNLDLPSLPLAQDQQVIAQIKNEEGECWEARFSRPAAKNAVALFKDKADAAIAFPPTATPTPPIALTATPTPTPNNPATPTPTSTGPTSTPTATHTPGEGGCGNGYLEPGESYDEPGFGFVGDTNGAPCASDASIEPCTPSAAQSSIDVFLQPPPGTFPTGFSILLGYKSDAVQIPGFALATTVRQRVTFARVPAPTFFPNDRDYALRVLTTTTIPFDAGKVFSVRFDLCTGGTTPEFGCIVEGCTSAGGAIEDCTCTIAPTP